MREIKFRVWSNTFNIMLGFNHLQFVYKNGNIQNVNSTLFTTTAPLTDYVLEQFTGLTDKNGVEIYEGDKCKVNNNSGDVGVIKYVLGQYLLVGKNNKHFAYELYDNGEYIEIIGNIHENKESD